MSGPEVFGAAGSDRDINLEEILAVADEPTPPGHRSGMVSLVGRPNVGKSTLMNALVGEKVAIVTRVPGTTRNAIRGVLTRDDSQVVFLDTPGLTRPKTLLTRRLNDLVRDTWTGVDLLCFLVEATKGVTPSDRLLAEQLADVPTRKLCLVTKEDRVKDRNQMLPLLTEVGKLGDWLEIVPVSAVSGFNLDVLLDVLVRHLPEGPRLFPVGRVSDQPERQRAAEILREKLIARMGDEVPHSIMVVVEELAPDPDRDDVLRIEAVVFVERDSQKGIVIGKGASVLKEAGTEARHELEVLFGSKVHLETRVKVAKEWQADPKALGRFGY